jgi:hypothetical protein
METAEHAVSHTATPVAVIAYSNSVVNLSTESDQGHRDQSSTRPTNACYLSPTVTKPLQGAY